MSDFDGSNRGNALPAAVLCLLTDDAKANHLPVLASYLLGSYRRIGEDMRNGDFGHHEVGTQNTFGDDQLHVDVETDRIMFDCLRDSDLVSIASSEEDHREVDMGGSGLGGTGFSVAFDPLDGSSVVDANFAVGTIVGIWPGRGLLGRTGREQQCAMVCQYGPRVTVALAFNASVTSDGRAVSMELTMHGGCWVVSHARFVIKETAKTFAPGNLRATADNPQYMALVNYYLSHQYTLRYSGGLVPDIYHILIKGQGVLTNCSSAKAKAKLRLLFECAPIALIIEAAGGASCVCSSEVGEPCEPTSVLDVVATDMDKRIGVCYGSKDEVDRFRSHIF